MTVESKVILLVDDDPGIREVCFKILAGDGYEVLEADNAMEALIVAATHNGAISLLLANRNLAGTNGCDLARAFGILWPAVGHLYMSSGPETDSNARVVLQPIQAESLLNRVHESMGTPVHA